MSLFSFEFYTILIILRSIGDKKSSVCSFHPFEIIVDIEETTISLTQVS